MNLDQWLSCAAATTSLIAGIVLAISLNKLLGAYDLSFTGLEATVETLAAGGDIMIVTGTDRHRHKGRKAASLLTVTGFVLLFASTAFAIASVAVAGQHLGSKQCHQHREGPEPRLFLLGVGPSAASAVFRPASN